MYYESLETARKDLRSKLQAYDAAALEADRKNEFCRTLSDEQKSASKLADAVEALLELLIPKE